MKKTKKLKVKYLYLEPKTPEAQETQQKTLDEVFGIIFNKVAEK